MNGSILEEQRQNAVWSKIEKWARTRKNGPLFKTQYVSWDFGMRSEVEGILIGMGDRSYYMRPQDFDMPNIKLAFDGNGRHPLYMDESLFIPAVPPITTEPQVQTQPDYDAKPQFETIEEFLQ